MIDNGSPLLSEIELPAKGSRVQFQAGDREYLIVADQHDAWTLFDGGSRLLSFVAHDGGFMEHDPNYGPGERSPRWQQLVGRIVR